MIIELSKALCIPAEKLLGRDRTAHIAIARGVYFWLLYRNGFSYNEISKLTERTHSSILQAVKKVSAAIEVGDKKVTEIVSKIEHIKR